MPEEIEGVEEVIVPSTDAPSVSEPPAEEPSAPAAPAVEPKEEVVVKTDDEPRVPYSRFDEVNRAKHEADIRAAAAEARLSELQNISGRRELTPEEKQEQQAQEWVQKQIDAALAKQLGPLREKAEQAEKVSAEEKAMVDRLTLIRTADKTVDEKVEGRLYDLISEYHIGNSVDKSGRPVHAIDTAYQLWKKLEGEKHAAEVAGAKKAAASPQQPHPGRSGDATAPVDTSNKSLYQIAEEASAEFGLT